MAVSLYNNLAKPIKIGRTPLSNRIVMPPMVLWIAPPDAVVTGRAVEHYSRCKGPGLVIVEATAVAPEGRLSADQIGIFDDRHVEGLRLLAAAIHANGARAAIQIHHAGRNTRTRRSFFGLGLVAPSAINAADAEVPRELTEDGIERIIRCFADASRRAADAGFDGVELHAAHGFLISQFLSPLANERRDRWGGSLENRARFLMEILARIGKEAGGRIEAWCRLGVADSLPGGLTLDEGFEVARWLKSAGVPVLHASSGLGDPLRVAPEGSPYSDRFHLGALLKRAVDLPVISVGGIRRPELAERAVAEGLTDLVAVGRGMLADPQWALKAIQGRPDAIHYCRDCPECHHFDNAEKCPARVEADVARRKGAA